MSEAATVLVVEALTRAARNPTTHQYPSNRGTDEFRAAVAEFYKGRFGVDVDPETDVIPVLGGKEGVAHVALATLDPGDTALAPDPGYPPYTSGPVFSGANVHYLPLSEEHGFLPELDAAPDGQVLAQAESVAVAEGRALTRKSLEAVLNDQAPEAEKKGRPAEPAAAAGRGTIAARGRARSSRRPAR